MRFGGVVPRLKVLSEFDSMLVEKLSGVCDEYVEILAKKFREGRGNYILRMNAKGSRG